MSADGNTVVLGSSDWEPVETVTRNPGSPQGSPLNYRQLILSGRVKVFDWDGSDWNQRGSDIVSSWRENASAYNGDVRFGRIVDISGDGNTIAIFSELITNSLGPVDTANVFSWDEGQWEQINEFRHRGREELGTSLALNDNGEWLAIATNDRWSVQPVTGPNRFSSTAVLSGYRWGASDIEISSDGNTYVRANSWFSFDNESADQDPPTAARYTRSSESEPFSAGARMRGPLGFGASVALTSDGERWFIRSREEGVVYHYTSDGEGNELLATIERPDGVASSMAANDAGSMIAIAGQGQVHVFRIAYDD